MRSEFSRYSEANFCDYTQLLDSAPANGIRKESR